MVKDAVVVSAQHHEVRELGLPAGYPVRDVVGVAHQRGPVAAGERAVPVAKDQGGPDGEGDQSLGAADVEWFASAAEDGGDDLGVTRQPPDRRDREVVDGVGGQAVT